MLLEFKADTKERKQWFTAESFAHPAKMSLPLQLWLIDKYTKLGDVILDPMAGIGTILVGATIGRNIICVELEEKFCWMMFGNAEKIMQRGPQMGYKMGRVDIIQGDARNLEGALVDKIITSPPYAEAQEGSGLAKNPPKSFRGVLKNFTQKQGDDINNVSNLPYGNIDAVVTSPPYQKDAELHGESHDRGRQDGIRPRQPYIDAVVTSPPYEGSFTHSEQNPDKRFKRLVEVDKEGVRKGDKWAITSEEALRRRLAQQDGGYGANVNNIGNLKSESYLAAMLRVYQQCQLVLKPEGLMTLVTKNFIRNKQVIHLDLDTIKLCEQAGFSLLEHHYRKLPAQSFWRIIYHKKYPGVEKIEYEDILVFKTLC